MASQITEWFLEQPSQERFAQLKRDGLKEIALELYDVVLQKSMSKYEMQIKLIELLEDDDKVISGDLVAKTPPGVVTQQQLEIRRLELEREDREREDRWEERDRDREKADREREDRREEREREKEKEDREERERREQREFDLEKLKIEMSGSSHRSFSSPEPRFDVTRHVRLVPAFDDKDVENYFSHFEKTASKLEWPTEFWTLLLQTALRGKAREVYAALSLTDSGDYDLVKKTVLKAYELVPEAYRQKFRFHRKSTEQSHLDFARVKEQLFDRWTMSKEVKDDFGKLRQLILLEEFKKCVQPDIKSHIDEHKVDTLQEAALMADDYALTHKLRDQKDTRDNRGYNKHGPNKSFQQPTAGYKSQSNSNGDNRSSGTLNPGSEDERRGGSGPKSSIVCNYCKRSGHTLSECYSLKRKEERKPQSFPSAFTVVVQDNPTDIEPVYKVKGSQSDEVCEEFQPFVYEGFVSLVGHEGMVKPIKILRDTASLQSLILEGVLPLSEDSSEHADVLLRGVELGVSRAPLHKIHLQSDFVTGPVVVGVRSAFPMEGISMLLGNDLAGSQALPDPIVTKVPSSDVDEVGEVVFPVCAVTRSMTRKFPTPHVVSPDNSEVDGLQLNDTFFAELGDDSLPGEKLASEGLVDSSVSKVGLKSDGKLGSRKLLIEEQSRDSELLELCKDSLLKDEAEKVPVCSYREHGMLVRKWRPPDVPADSVWEIVHQIVRVLQHFCWPGLKGDVVGHCRVCHVWSNFLSGLFQWVNRQLEFQQFKFSAYYPEARGALEGLYYPESQGDLEGLYYPESQGDLEGLYYPESQGDLEGLYQTFERMLRTFCLGFGWCELFAARGEHDDLGFSLFELVFGRNLFGPLKLLEETRLGGGTQLNILEYVSGFEERLKVGQNNMKTWCGKGAGELVLECRHLFSDAQTGTGLVCHGVDVGGRPCRVDPLRDDLIEVSDSEYSSPCILVLKSDGTSRFCTDYCEIDSVTGAGSCLVTGVDDGVEETGPVKDV